MFHICPLCRALLAVAALPGVLTPEPAGRASTRKPCMCSGHLAVGLFGGAILRVYGTRGLA